MLLDIFIVSLLAMTVALFLLTRLHLPILGPRLGGIFSPFVLLSLPIGIVVFLLLFIVRKKFFPIGVFAINQGLKRHQDREKIRTIVIAGLIINVVAGMVVAFLIGG